MLDQAGDAKLDPAVRTTALAALERAVKLRKERAAGALPAPVGKLLADESPAVQEAAARLAGSYKLSAVKSDLEAKLSDASAKEALRVKDVLVDEGDLVRPGQVLVRLDTSTIDEELAKNEVHA